MGKLKYKMLTKLKKIKVKLHYQQEQMKKKNLKKFDKYINII